MNNNTSKLSLSELNKLYMENKESFEKVRRIAAYKPKTFKTLSLAEGAKLYELVGEERYRYYAANSTEEIVELRPNSHAEQNSSAMLKQREKELGLLKEQLRMEREQLEIEKMRLEIEQQKKELGLL